MNQPIISKSVSVIILISVFMFSGDLLSQTDHSQHQHKPSEPKKEEQKKKEKIYYCVMHPYIKRNQPGICPICSMQLVEMDENAQKDSKYMHLNKNQLSQAGVVKDSVRYRKLSRHIDTSGRIDYDERKVSTVTAWIGGRIEKLHVNFTGVQVKKGEPLADFYSPDLITTQEEYLEAIIAFEKIKKSRDPKAIQNAKDLISATQQRLLRWGVSEEQIERLRTAKKVSDRITIFAPTSGTVIEKKIEEGRYVKEGTQLFRISDLALVWLYADIYEYELPLVEVGQEVIISTRAFPGQKFRGKIRFIDPFIQPQTRTARVRVDIDNQDLSLKPGMYARAEIHATSPKTLSVSESAVISTGKRDILFVAHQDEVFEPREVLVGRKYLYTQGRSTDTSGLFGAHFERYHEILDGVHDGEDVVKYGTFLLNAESQLQGVVAKLLPVQTARAESSKPAVSETVAAPVLSSLKKEINILLEHYFSVQRLLTQNETKDIEKIASAAKTGLKKLKNRFSKIEDKDEQRWWKEKASEWGQSFTHMEAFKKKPDIEIARQWYAQFSYFVLAYVSRYRDHLDVGQYAAFSCPMTKAGFNRWLQKDKKINNPYMGKMMSTCGVPLDIQKIKVK